MTAGLIELDLRLQSLTAAAQLNVVDAASAEAAAAAGKALKEFAKKIAEKKAAALAPIKEEQKKITEAFAPIEKKIDEAIKKLTIALQSYNAAQRRAVKETQRAIDAARADALLAGEQPTPAKALVETPPKTITTRRLKRLKIVDSAKIPREFLQPDERKIFDALKSGKTVPGAVLEEYESAYI